VGLSSALLDHADDDDDDVAEDDADCSKDAASNESDLEKSSDEARDVDVALL
jgi:hypothetical protein